MIQYRCTKMLFLVVLFSGVCESHYQHPSHDFVPANFTGEMKHAHSTCNKYFCVSVVSYCTLQKKCYCNPKKDCSCCKECAVCLGKYYKHCCDCVGECFVFIPFGLAIIILEYLPTFRVYFFGITQ